MQTTYQQVQEILSQGNASLAEDKLRQLLQIKPKNIDFLSLLGRSLMMQNKNTEAKLVFKKIIKNKPHTASAFAELARLYLSERQANDAELAAKRAVEIDPTFSEAWHLLGNLLMQRGARKNAKNCFNKAELYDPFREQFIKVLPALHQNQFQQVEKICHEVLKQNKHHPQALYSLAIIAEQTGAFEEAVKILESGLKNAPYHTPMIERLVVNFALSGQLSEAIETAQMLQSIEPDSVRYKMLLASQLANAGRNEESLDYFDQVISLDPDNFNVHLERGHVLRYMGQRADCEAAYRKSLQLEKINGAAYWALAHLKSFRFSEADKINMQRLLDDKNLPKSQVSMASFSLAKYYEDKNDYESAFQYYQRGNQLKSNINITPENYQNIYQDHRVNFTEKTLVHQADPEPSGPTPIFIVGITRSGSTLIEQILASHTLIEGTMELYSLQRTVRRAKLSCVDNGLKYPQEVAKLNAQKLTSLGQSYLDETAIYRTGKPYFIDKLPLNFFDVGLIHMILPQALIIDARRHPLATGLSNYRQHYSQGYDYSYDLGHIGYFYNNYLKMMDHWNKVLPHKVLCVQYENMVLNTEEQVREILNYCKLDFEEQCLKFYENKRLVKTASSEQVRQPMNTKGLQQWRKYEKYLTPLKEALGKDTLERFEQWYKLTH